MCLIDPYISVVTTTYNSANYLSELILRLKKVLAQIPGKAEIILVNDCSPDDSLALAFDLQKSNSIITIIDLARNFGQHRAMLTGLSHSRGKLVFVLESDLEEQPEYLLEFYTTLQGSPNADVVYGVQESRKGKIFERISGELFYTLFNSLSDIRIPKNHITARLMTRRYVDALLQYEERALFLGGLYSLVGFVQIPVKVVKLSHSPTTYSFQHRLVLVVEAIFSFSTVPLRILFWVGMVVLLLSLVMILVVLGTWIIRSTFPGWTSILASIWLIGGILILGLSTLGYYIKTILIEVKGRPHTTIKNIYRASER